MILHANGEAKKNLKLTQSIQSLQNIYPGRIALDTTGLQKLRNATGFTQIYIYCQIFDQSLQSRKTVKIYTTSLDFVDYVTGVTNERPQACNSFTATGTFTLKLLCKMWEDGKWSTKTTPNRFRMYDNIAKVPHSVRISMITDWECDSVNADDSNGVWQLYVR